MPTKLQHLNQKINIEIMVNSLKNNSLINYTFDSKSGQNGAKRCGKGKKCVLRFDLTCDKGSKDFGIFLEFFQPRLK